MWSNGRAAKPSVDWRSASARASKLSVDIRKFTRTIFISQFYRSQIFYRGNGAVYNLRKSRNYVDDNLCSLKCTAMLFLEINCCII